MDPRPLPTLPETWGEDGDRLISNLRFTGARGLGASGLPIFDLGKWKGSAARPAEGPESFWRTFVDLWNHETRMAAVWLLTPKVSNGPRERFGLPRQDLCSVRDRSARS